MNWFLYDNGLRHERVNKYICLASKVIFVHSFDIVRTLSALVFFYHSYNIVLLN